MLTSASRPLVLFVAAFSFASAIHADNLHIKKSVSVNGNAISSTETWISGDRERTVNGATTTVHQSDLKRTLTINNQAQAYVVAEDPVDENVARAAALAAGSPADDGGGVVIKTNIIDTKERKQMFGYAARHLKTALAIEPSAGSCLKQSQKFEVDGWYADILKTPAGWSGFTPPTQTSEGCHDKLLRRSTGTGKPGYPLMESITLHNPDGSTTQLKIETTDLTQEAADATMFDVPAGFRQVNSLSELQGLASSAQQAAVSQAQPNSPGAYNAQAMTQAQAQAQMAMQRGNQMGQMGTPQAGGNPTAMMQQMQQMQQMTGAGGQQQTSAAAVPTKILGPKAPGKIRIGVAPPDAQVGQGNNAGDYSTPIRNSIVLLMDGPAVEIAPLDARIPIQLQAEAQQKQCDYILYSGVTVKHDSGGSFGKIMKMAAPVANMTPIGAMQTMNTAAAAQAAAQAAANVAAVSAQQQAVSQLAGFNGQVKQKDNVTVQYQLVPTGQTTPRLQNTMQAKAKSDGEDVLTPILQQTANAVLTEVTKK